MKCNEACELMLDYVNGELDEDLSEEIRSHIENCEQCKKEYEFAIGMSNAVKNAEYIAPDELHRYIMSGVKAEQKRIKRNKILRNVVAIGSSVAIFVFAIGIIWNGVDSFVQDNANKSEQSGEEIRADNIFTPSYIDGENKEGVIILSVDTAHEFAGEYQTKLTDGRAVKMIIGEDKSVVICITDKNGFDTYYDGMLSFDSKGSVSVTQSDGNLYCKATIKMVMKNGDIYLDIVSGKLPWEVQT